MQAFSSQYPNERTVDSAVWVNFEFEFTFFLGEFRKRVFVGSNAKIGKVSSLCSKHFCTRMQEKKSRKQRPICVQTKLIHVHVHF